MTFAVDDEFGNQITAGLSDYGAAKQVARKYLSAHEDAPCVEIYTSSESWTLTRKEITAS